MSDTAQRTALLWIVATGFFMQTLDSTIVNTALPSIAKSLHESPLAMQPVIVAYTLTMAMLTPASGWLADRYGTRDVYVVSILLFVLGSACCAGAQSLPELVMARVLQGLGGSMLIPIGRLTILRNSSAGDYIAALAVVSVAGQVGPLLGPTLRGLLVQAATWQWIYLINLPIGAVGLLAVRKFVPQSRLEGVSKFDLYGCALLSLGMVAISLAMDVPAVHHKGVWTSGLLALSAIAVLLYLVQARREKAPLFRLGLFREPNFGIGLLGNLITRIGCSAVPFLLPLLLQLQLNYSPVRSGLMMVPAALAGITSKAWISKLVHRYGYGRFLLFNTAIVGTSIASFGLITPQWPLWLQLVQLAVFGGANSMQFAAMNSVTLKGLSASDAGSGNSLFSMVQMLALGLGATVGGVLVNGLYQELHSAALAFRYAFIGVGAMTVASGLVFRWLREDFPSSEIDRVQVR